jgi:uncharacterized RDD family membrane protein YckC
MASADYSVLTPERVSLQYDIAGIGSRGAAAIVDTLIQAVVLTVLFMAVTAAAAIASSLPGVGAPLGRGGTTLVLGLFALVVLLVTAGYFMVWEILWSGQTPGKRLVGVRVIRESGYPLRPVDAVIRNLVRIVDWLPLFYGVGMLVMLLNGRARRLGDFASGTIVVRERAPRMPTPPTAEARGPVLLAPADAALVRDFLVRRVGMHRRARADLAARIATALGQRYGLGLEGEDPETFLERLSL